MSFRRHSGARRVGAFTLIELLVVVAIITLLISILAPSLTIARDHARTTLCLSRMGQFGKAFLLYADDYNETPPFVATMHGGSPDANETWLADWKAMEEQGLATLEEVSKSYWDDLDTRVQRMIPRSGTMFPYANFEALYRCPQFERVDHPLKSQSVFNYTRAIWGRHWKIYREEMELFGEATSEWGGVKYPIMKVSMIHAPSRLPMLLDEQWDRHVATAGCYGDNGSGYNANDYGFFADNIIGVYHGAKTISRYHELDRAEGYVPFLWKRGTIFCYDGHAELQRDPWPTYPLGSGYLARKRNVGREAFRTEGVGKSGFDEINAVSSYMNMLVYAQRGYDPVQRYGRVPPSW